MTKYSQLKLSIFLALIIFAPACSGSKPEGTTDGSSSPITAALSGGVEAFEGIVTSKMFAGENEGQMTYAIKGHLSRIETSAQATGQPMTGIMIMDTKAGKMTMLSPATKSYMDMSFGMGEAETEKKFEDLPKITPTGKTETIAGYTCEHYLFGDDQKTDLCIAGGLGFFGMGDNERGVMASLRKLSGLDSEAAEKLKANPEWKKFMENGAFPLKMSQIENGKTQTIMEVTGIERKKLDDSLFTIPADYKKMEIPGMPQIKR